jgi:hypothetical protein
MREWSHVQPGWGHPDGTEEPESSSPDSDSGGPTSQQEALTSMCFFDSAQRQRGTTPSRVPQTISIRPLVLIRCFHSNRPADSGSPSFSTQQADERDRRTLWRFGPAVEGTLLKIARSPGDGVEQLAAWTSLSATERFSRDSELASEAKAFPTRMDPNLFGTPSDKWSSSLADKYQTLVAKTYLLVGSPADIPTLQKMAENPRLPFSSSERSLEVFRQAMRTAIDAIRMRSN